MGIMHFTHAPMRVTWVKTLSEEMTMNKIQPFFVQPRPKPDYSHLFLHSTDYGTWNDDEKYIVKKKKTKKEKKHYE